MTSKRSSTRRTVAVTAVSAAALLLAACGGNDVAGAGHGGHTSKSPSASAPPESGDHNAADVTFAKGMIPHHRQAVEMAGLAPSRAASPEVEKLAEEVKKAQGPELERLSEWLTAWGEKVPAEGAMDHSLHGAGGMLTAQQMQKLENSSGKAFDKAFMEMMIEHHEGAVKMARTEQADGAYEPAKKLAEEIVSAQTGEIEKMNKLLGTSGS